MDITVHTSPDHIRAGALSPHAVHQELQRGGPLLYNVTPGTGKTEAMYNYVASYLWRVLADTVVMFFYTRQQCDEAYEKLIRRGVRVRLYPEIDDMKCGGPDSMRELNKRCLGIVTSERHCDSCEHYQGEELCEWTYRTKPLFATGFDVIIATEALLRVMPDITSQWGIERPLVIIDEAKVGDEGFIATFTLDDVELTQRVAYRCDEWEIADCMLQLRMDPRSRPVFPQIKIPWGKLVYRMQTRGEAEKHYRFILPTIMAYLQDPLWQEGGTFAVLRRPLLPKKSLIFLGAFLDPDYLARRYHIARPRPIMDGIVVKHPETDYVQVRSGVGAVRNRTGNIKAIAHLVIDQIAQNLAEGRTTVLFVRKGDDEGERRGSSADDCELLRDLARKRGLPPVQFLTPGTALPQVDGRHTSHPQMIPCVHYGMVGINAYEAYDTGIFLHGFFVPPEAVTELVFGHLPPRKRPTMTGRSGAVPIWNPPLSPEMQAFSQQALFRLEADAVLQAIHRIRPGISPRLVVFTSVWSLKRYLGDVSEVANLTLAREHLDLGSTVDGRRGRLCAEIQTLLVAGLSLREAARRVRVSYRTAKRWKQAGRVSTLPTGITTARPLAGGGSHAP
jgi:hypothetical protein